MSDADDVITLPVPEAVSAVYLVPTSQPPDDPVGLVLEAIADRWTYPLRAMVTDVLQPPYTPIEVRTTADLPPPPIELLGAMGATSEQLATVGSATHFVVVAVRSPVGWPPAHEWVSRAIATVLAEQLRSDVIDVLNYQVLDVARAAATLPDADGRTRLADWVWIDYSPDRHGYWCTTTGLRRFGLPELQTLTAPPSVVEQWGNAMTGIAQSLVRGWSEALSLDRDAAFVQLPNLLVVSAEDVAAAYGHEVGAGSGSATVRLVLDPHEDPEHHAYLTIHPPLSWPGSAGEHIAEVCAALFGARTSEVRRIHPSEAMDRAIAAARAGMNDIRLRFESGQLELHTKLLVKYALPAEQGNEYLWAYVTSWRDPYRILATSADDAVYHPKVRAGRPVVVDTAAIVDWAVEHDELGIVEGGWTQPANDDD